MAPMWVRELRRWLLDEPAPERPVLDEEQAQQNTRPLGNVHLLDREERRDA